MKYELRKVMKFLIFIFSLQFHQVSCSLICNNGSFAENSMNCFATVLNNSTDFSRIPETTERLKIIRFPYLEKIDNFIPENAFRTLKNLSELNIEDFCLFEMKQDFLRGLHLLRSLKLNVNSNRVDTISNEIVIENFPSNIYSALEEMEIVFQAIRHIAENFFCSFPSLKHLNLSKNHLSAIEDIGCGVNNSCCSNLVSLNLTENVIRRINSPQTFNGLENLNNLFLEDNGIHFLNNFSNIFSSLPNLVQLDLDWNAIEFLPFNIFNSQPKLKILHLNGNFLTNESLDRLKPLKSLEYLSLDHNVFKSITFEFFNLPLIRGISLRYNRIAAISSSAFKNCFNLRYLYLSFNSISVLSDDTYFKSTSNIFTSNSLPKLEKLDLSFNEITDFDYSLIPNSLKELQLYPNPLRWISDVHAVTPTLKLENLTIASLLINNSANFYFPPSLKFLSFPYSNVTIISAEVFSKLRNLERLQLGSNIQHVERFAFSSPLGSHSLLEIDVDNNFHDCSCSFEYKKKCIHQNTKVYEIKTILVNQRDFKRIGVCQYVKKCSSQNCFGDILSCSSYADKEDVITDCGHLKFTEVPYDLPSDSTEVYLDGNNIVVVDLDPILTRIPGIISLFLNKSNIQQLRTNVYSNSLMILHLEDNLLMNLEPYMFINFPSLKYVGLHNNSLQWALNGNKYFYCLEDLHLEDNKIQHFHNINLAYGRCQLRNLFLQRNEISEIKVNSEICHGEMQILHLENNKISSMNFNYAKMNFVLEKLFLQNNNISVLPSDWCFYRLKELHLERNKIVRIENFQFKVMFHLKTLFLQDNDINYIEDQGLRSTEMLVELHLENNRLAYLSNVTFSALIDLQLLYINNNKLTSLDSDTFKRNTKLKKLFLDHNSIEVLNEGLFEQLSALEVVSLSSNRISEIPVNLFAFTTQLRELYLDDNKIVMLRGKEFKNLELLVKLYLNHNDISYIDEDTFTGLSSLQFLTLHNNRLQKPEFWNLFPSSFYLYVTINENTIVCDCEYVRELRVYLKEMSRLPEANRTVSKVIDMKCLLEEEYSFLIDDFWFKYCESKERLLIIIVSSLASVVIIVLLGAVCYRYRLEIQIFLYAHFGIRFYNGIMDEGKQFDAFIAYSYSDWTFVANELLPRLENYRLCLHDLHFLAGFLISENINNAVELSCCTVMIITSSFAKSEWCRLEFRTARLKSLTDRTRRLIAIVLEDIDTNDMDDELQTYLQTNTYLRWNEHNFWEKLYFVLPNANNQNNCVAENQVFALQLINRRN